MDKSLRDSYEAYQEAFYQDLNQYLWGLAALQMGMILLELAEGNEDGWKQMFDDDEEPDTYRKRLVRSIEALREIVPASVSSALSQMASLVPERAYAEITRAKICFLLCDSV